MTEAEWLGCANPAPMLAILGDRATDRKLRLFVIACCRRLQDPWPVPEEFGEFLEWAEQFADGSIGPDELAIIFDELDGYVHDYAPDWWTGIAAMIACAVRLPQADPGRVHEGALRVVRYDRFPDEDRSEAENQLFRAQAGFLRDVVGLLPFRPIVFATEWRTSTVLALARQMYESRDFSAMPILADALQDAGCENSAVLDHCRDPGPHTRGCWVVDLILGKE